MSANEKTESIYRLLVLDKLIVGLPADKEDLPNMKHKLAFVDSKASTKRRSAVEVNIYKSSHVQTVIHLVRNRLIFYYFGEVDNGLLDSFKILLPREGNSIQHHNA